MACGESEWYGESIAELKENTNPLMTDITEEVNTVNIQQGDLFLDPDANDQFGQLFQYTGYLWNMIPMDQQYEWCEFDLFDISMVVSDEHPIQESDEDKYDRAMSGI